MARPGGKAGTVVNTASIINTHLCAAGPVPPDPLVLWCCECGGSAPYPVEDIDRFAANGWPVCCGEVMSLVTTAGLPVAGKPAAI